MALGAFAVVRWPVISLAGTCGAASAEAAWAALRRREQEQSTLLGEAGCGEDERPTCPVEPARRMPAGGIGQLALF